jgi:UDPglucose--hexose-1-phosphate uridylyltransferase
LIYADRRIFCGFRAHPLRAHPDGSILKFTVNSQLRLNPLNGRWVTIVSSRAARPTDFAPRTADVEADPSRPCPFCPGNEESTPPALVALDADGAWNLRIVPNLYPAFEGNEMLAVRNHGPVHVAAEASGVHEVFVYTPSHHGSLADLSDAQAAQAMSALRDRFVAHAAMPNVRYTQAIVNHGREAGASLSHPHGQILGMPFVPGAILDEERAFARFDGGCILCATVEAEMVDEARVILANDDVIVVAPYWSGMPFELLAIPRRHAVHMQDADDNTLAAVGIALRDSIAALTRLHGDVAFNLVIHTAPHNHSGQFHWHAHLLPQLTTVAGFERGTGVMINIVPPEDASQALREVMPVGAR